MNLEIYKSLEQMHIKIDSVKEDVRDIDEKINSLDCRINNDKLKRLEKIVYSAIAIILCGFMVTLVNITGANTRENIYKPKIKISKKVKF